jgi:hypothetical protein
MSVNITNLDNSNVAASANIMATKKQGKFNLTYSKTGTVAADKAYLRIVAGATGTLLKVQALVTETIATGGDRVVHVDVQKSTGGGAFASVLSATIDFTSASVLLTASAGTFSSTSIQAGDVLMFNITVAGAAGNQALGLLACLTIAEDAGNGQ